MRIEAVESLASECLEHRIFQMLCVMVGDEGSDVAVRSAIVRVLPRWGDNAMQVMAIVRALSLPACVRRPSRLSIRWAR